ncbi:hypothetical protein PROFUN_14860 [Planoprotostelium fungivorum]|uniref:Uncharacterized protein n=1 Tax=Planoprotostelium fungivorum TaxID=1890364 RepID=A0A2P6MYM8_9EUKA|nr:hypothetical protein PROFUN_14860 [Planoprotostelium fungivorum]
MRCDPFLASIWGQEKLSRQNTTIMRLSNIHPFSKQPSGYGTVAAQQELTPSRVVILLPWIISLIHRRSLCHDAIKQDCLDVLKWALDNGYPMHLNAVFFHEEKIYHSLLEPRTDHQYILAVEHLLQRKWKKSAEEVEKWFDREPGDITVTWLEDLWKYGPEEESPKRKRNRVE